MAYKEEQILSCATCVLPTGSEHVQGRQVAPKVKIINTDYFVLREHRVLTLLSSSNFMAFHDFFHDIFSFPPPYV